MTNPLHDVSTVDSPGNNTRSESSGNTAAEPVLHSLNGVTTCRETGKACQLVDRPRAPTFTGAGIALPGWVDSSNNFAKSLEVKTGRGCAINAC